MPRPFHYQDLIRNACGDLVLVEKLILIHTWYHFKFSCEKRFLNVLFLFLNLYYNEYKPEALPAFLYVRIAQQSEYRFLMRNFLGSNSRG